MEMLNVHSPTCLKQGSGGANENTYNNQQFSEPSQLPLPSYQDNFVQPALNQPQNCVTDYPVKVEGYDNNGQDFYRQNSPYNIPTSDTGCTV